MTAARFNVWPWAIMGGTALGLVLLAKRSHATELAAVQNNRALSGRNEVAGVQQDGRELLPAFEGKAVSRAYDPIFERYGHGIPVAYLRSLAKRESDLNPNSSDGAAWGILQVIEVVRGDYNERHQTAYSRSDLLNPAVCTEIAGDLLSRIVSSYRRNHPLVPNMVENWKNPSFVELLTFGWNAGYSEKGGVGRVARFLTQAGYANEITIDSIFAAAGSAGASRHLQNEKKVAWCKGVARLYQREMQRADALT